MCGFLPSGTEGVISGRSGLRPQGFIVCPGVVDGDRKKEKIIANVKKEMPSEAGDRIAPLLFPHTKGNATPVERTGAF